MDLLYNILNLGPKPRKKWFEYYRNKFEIHGYQIALDGQGQYLNEYFKSVGFPYVRVIEYRHDISETLESFTTPSRTILSIIEMQNDFQENMRITHFTGMNFTYAILAFKDEQDYMTSYLIGIVEEIANRSI